MKEQCVPSSAQLPQAVALETTLSLCLHLLEELDTPRSLSMYLLIQNKEWDQVAMGLPIRAEWYLTAEEFFLDYQATKLLSKADFLPTSFDRRETALVRFESAESQCQQTNARWRSWYVDGSGLPPPDVDHVFGDMRRRIHRILGRFPAEDLADACRWGPGATTSIRNPRTSVYEKYLEPVTGSGQCLTLFGSLVDQIPLWKSFQRGFFCVSDGNKVVLVPKDAKTERSIAAEPSLDSYVQLGIGRLMRRRLARFGLDLDSQETNRDLARYGSLTGKVATVDLSMASDTLAKLPVDLLLPEDWLVPMKACRSAHWRMRGKSSYYYKFSSMGNGYTFELETLIFWTMAQAVASYLGLPDWEVTAFGDDLTIGVEGLDLLSRSLSAAGFTVNASKSFNDGAFRESCGMDYFLGTNVRPYFVRSLLRDVRDLMKFHNGLRRTLIPPKRTIARALRLARPEDRIFGPKELGDGVFHSDAPRGSFKLASRRYPMFEGFLVRHWVFKPEKERVKFLEPALLASLRSVEGASSLPQKGEGSPTLGFSTLRNRGTWVTRTVLVPFWD